MRYVLVFYLGTRVSDQSLGLVCHLLIIQMRKYSFDEGQNTAGYRLVSRRCELDDLESFRREYGGRLDDWRL